MAVLLSRLLFLVLVTRIKADGCFERFGSDEAKCKAAQGRCDWLENDGKGKCVMSVQKDACFERFGSNKTDCTATSGRCMWVEKGGEGKCLMPRRPKHQSKRTDGCFERFGSNKDSCIAADGLCLWVEKDGEGKCLMPRHHKGHNKSADGCSERFGTNKTGCTTDPIAKQLCSWVETDGDGQCMMPKHSKGHNKSGDGCFERFGSNEANCTATNGRCSWVEKDGKGTCMHKEGSGRMGKGGDADRMGKRGGHEAHDEGVDRISKEGGDKSREGGSDRIGKQDGADRIGAKHGREGERKVLQKIVGVVSISISSSMASGDVLENLNRRPSLLERALAHSHGYHKVIILGLDVARRLRSATKTQVHVRFEAEATQSLQAGVEANSAQVQLTGALQQSFVEAGLDFQVESATVTISSTEVVSRKGDKRHSSRGLVVGAIAAGFVLCFGASVLCMCLRRRRRSATKVIAGKIDLCVAPVYGVPCKDNDKCDADIDLASNSTGIPSTNDNWSEGCP